MILDFGFSIFDYGRYGSCRGQSGNSHERAQESQNGDLLRWRHGRALWVAAAMALGMAWAGVAAQAQDDPPLLNAVAYVRGHQNADGSFGGKAQPNLQTAAAMLALMSPGAVLTDADRQQIERAAAWLEKAASSGGELGDRVFVTESHALATLALLCSLDRIRAQGIREAVARRAAQGVQWLERTQDRGSASAMQGGWRMGGTESRANDRRATAWALLALYAARQAGLSVKDANLDRGVRYMLGAFKEKDPDPRQTGGFSVDAEGLAVEAMSAMGGWLLTQYGAGDESRAANQRWLAQHMPGWTGPNYFYANFFRARALKFGDRDGKEYRRTRDRLRTQIKDRQQPDGSVDFPPGSAQNDLDMGPVFSTSFAVLILNVDESRLFFDEDFRVRPLF